MHPVLMACLAAAIVVIASALPLAWAWRIDKRLRRVTARAVFLKKEAARLEAEVARLEAEVAGYRTLYPETGWGDDNHKTYVWRRQPRD